MSDEENSEQSEPKPQRAMPKIRMPEELEAGVWANFAVVRHSTYEFTVDFIRLDFEGNRPKSGVVVQRVNMSPQFVEQLTRALNENIASYAAKSVPPDLADLGDPDWL